jgi:hypothetical protein
MVTVTRKDFRPYTKCEVGDRMFGRAGSRRVWYLIGKDKGVAKIDYHIPRNTTSSLADTSNFTGYGPPDRVLSSSNDATQGLVVDSFLRTGTNGVVS